MADAFKPLDPVTKQTCRWVTQRAALEHFARYQGSTQSQEHIKPLHWYVACRLVVEGGFRPDEVTPHPPLRIVSKPKSHQLIYDSSVATGGERTVLGGLKTKNVDVVVVKDGLGPVLTVSCKGTVGAFRNLTNRMEEAVGDCTNMHITYPAMVSGFLAVMRANREIEETAAQIDLGDGSSAAKKISANDIAIHKGGVPVESIVRYHTALRELTGRRGIRNDVSRYEAISLSLIESGNGANAGEVFGAFPSVDIPLRIENFFNTLYMRYDERFVYAAPDLKRLTSRLEWAPSSPLLKEDLISGLSEPDFDYAPRVADSD